MSLGDRELAHTSQAVHLSRILIPEKSRSLTITDRQIPVRMLSVFITVILERTGHGTKGEHLLVFLLITQHKHAFLIVIPVARHFIQVALRHQRCLRPHVAPLLVLQILDPALQLHHHLRTSGQKKRQSLSDHIHSGEELHLPPQLIVIAAFDVFQVLQMRFQFLLLLECRTIDTLQLRLIGITPPIRHG